ncbi:MAG: PKD domain-containing protein, partial [Bacteroidales bacterium]|nr:PKD domain-containing protein [Bacteroidales bacterium]
ANGAAYIVAEFGGTGDFSYYWNPGGYVTDAITGLNSGTYNVVITDINGCHVSYNVSIAETQPPHIDNINYGDALCHGGNNGWAEIVVSGGSSPYTYTWSPEVSSSSSSFNLTAGIYSVTVEDNDGCKLYANIPISSPDPIEIHTSEDRLICIGDSTLITAIASGGIGPYTFDWQGLGTGTSHFVSPNLTTEYFVHAIDANGCISNTQAVRIEVAPPLNILAVAPSTICYGEVVTIVATASGGDGNYVYHWSNGLVSVENTLQITAVESGQISVYVTDGCNTPADTAMVVVNIAPGPEINLLKYPYKGCAPLNVEFDNITNVQTYTYDWDFGDPSSGTSNWSDLKQTEHYYENPGTYTISCEVTTNIGCKDTEKIVIVVHDAPNADFQAHPWSTGLFDSKIDFSDITDDAVAWEWDFGDGYKSGLQNPQHTYLDYGKYPVKLIAYSKEGCSDTVVKAVEIIEDMLFYVPTAINVRSPGNNEFYPKGTGIDFLSYTLTVYNRWGEPIFITHDFNERWQGRYSNNKGDYVPQGVYAWVITLTDKWGKDHTFSGNVTVFK